MHDAHGTGKSVTLEVVAGVAEMLRLHAVLIDKVGKGLVPRGSPQRPFRLQHVFKMPLICPCTAESIFAAQDSLTPQKLSDS